MGVIRMFQSETYYPNIDEDTTEVTAVEFGVLRLNDGFWWDFDGTPAFEAAGWGDAWQACVEEENPDTTGKTNWIYTTGWALPDADAHYLMKYKLTDGTGDYYRDGDLIMVNDATPLSVNATQISGSSAAADNLEASAEVLKTGTVSHDVTAATKTVFYSDDITTAAESHWVGRLVIFTSGLLQYQITDISAYELVAGEGKFTVTAVTSAPADNVTFVIQ